MSEMWAHQQRTVDLAFAAYLAGQPHFALFKEQGTGKTRSTIEIMRRIFTHLRRPCMTLIVCPQIVVRNWRKEVERFSKLGQFVQVIDGRTAKHRIKQIDEGKAQGKKIFVTNMEALSTVEGLLWETKTKGKSEVRIPINHGWEMFIVDEAHRLKNGTAKSTKLAIRIADKCYFKYLLTGTPISNNEQDIWALFRILDGGQTFGESFLSFRNEWFFDANSGMPSAKHFPNWKLRPGVAGKMHELIYKKAIRVTKEECMDLPPLVMKEIEVGMSPKQRKAYDEMRRDFITYLDSSACVAQFAITKALRLQQIASGFMKMEDGQEVQFTDCPKLDALAELFEDIPGKIIVWASFEQNYRAVAAVCEKMGRSYTFITGQQSQAEKNAAEQDFTKGETQILIANPAAGGTGVNLVEAATAIWFSRSFKLIDRLQAIARNHRGGSEMHAKITAIDLVSEDSIDTHVLSALTAKEQIAENILSWRARV